MNQLDFNEYCISLILTNKCFTKRAYFPEGLLSREGLLFSMYGIWVTWKARNANDNIQNRKLWEICNLYCGHKSEMDYINQFCMDCWNELTFARKTALAFLELRCFMVSIDLIQHQNFQEKRNSFHGRFTHKTATF